MCVCYDIPACFVSLYSFMMGQGITQLIGDDLCVGFTMSSLCGEDGDNSDRLCITQIIDNYLCMVIAICFIYDAL